ncbi:MAG: CheR family methyltransferase [Candidatus Helarchaeota archaeon]
MFKNLLIKLGNETGINFGYYRENFVKKRIKSRMIRLNLEDPISYLNYINETPGEIEKFLNGFTINTSYFFRNLEVYEQIENLIYYCLKGVNILAKKQKKIMKSENKKNQRLSSREKEMNNTIFTKEIPLEKLSIFKKLNNKSINARINIWSCACASGEEPYSIAMLLDTLKKKFRNLPNYNIVASDVDQVALENAREGIYFEESVKEVPEYFLQQYFTRVKIYPYGLKYKIDNKIKKQVHFIQEDVTKRHEKTTKYDIIFCRYFLIYTEKTSRFKLIQILRNRLADGGLLILGKTETLFNLNHDLKLIDTRNHIYMKTKTFEGGGINRAN